MKDFAKTNYHTHTVRCQHAYGTEREYIEAAIKMGLVKLGFSDHVPCPFKDGYVSGIRMTMNQAKEYVETLSELRDEYRDRIKIYIGFEAEYIPEFFDEQLAFFQELGIDYLIMGQHFWVSESEGPYSGTPTSDDARIRNYVDSIIEGMKTGKFTYLAHPDLINYQGIDSVYEWEMTRLCKAMKEMSIPLEINLGGMQEGKHYPNEKFWKIAAEVGNDAIIGLDAHDVCFIENEVDYAKCKSIADQFGIRLLDDVMLKSL